MEAFHKQREKMKHERTLDIMGGAEKSFEKAKGVGGFYGRLLQLKGYAAAPREAMQFLLTRQGIADWAMGDGGKRAQKASVNLKEAIRQKEFAKMATEDPAEGYIKFQEEELFSHSQEKGRLETGIAEKEEAANKEEKELGEQKKQQDPLKKKIDARTAQVQARFTPATLTQAQKHAGARKAWMDTGATEAEFNALSTADKDTFATDSESLNAAISLATNAALAGDTAFQSLAARERELASVIAERQTKIDALKDSVIQSKKRIESLKATIEPLTTRIEALKDNLKNGDGSIARNAGRTMVETRRDTLRTHMETGNLQGLKSAIETLAARLGLSADEARVLLDQHEQKLGANV